MHFSFDRGSCFRQIEGLLSNLEESIISVDDSMSSPASSTVCPSAEKERQIRIVQQISDAFQYFKRSAQAHNFESPDNTADSIQHKVQKISINYILLSLNMFGYNFTVILLILGVCFVRRTK